MHTAVHARACAHTCRWIDSLKLLAFICAHLCELVRITFLNPKTLNPKHSSNLVCVADGVATAVLMVL